MKETEANNEPDAAEIRTSWIATEFRCVSTPLPAPGTASVSWNLHNSLAASWLGNCKKQFTPNRVQDTNFRTK